MLRQMISNPTHSVVPRNAAGIVAGARHSFPNVHIFLRAARSFDQSK
jgi:hypothetical protein